MTVVDVITTVDIDLIDPDPDQPRQHFADTELVALAGSIDELGMAQPILLRPVGDRFEIVAGERRFLANKLLGNSTILAAIRDVSDADKPWVQLAENIARTDLNPVDEAEAFARLVAGGATHDAIAKRIGRTRSYVTQKLRVLELPPAVRSLVRAGRLQEGHARQIMRLKQMYPADSTVEVSRDTSPMPESFAAKGGSVGNWEIVAFLEGFRPLDIPIWYFPALCVVVAIEVDEPELFGDVWRATDGLGGDVPAWWIAASWYGIAAALMKPTVKTVGEEMDGFESTTDAALRFLTYIPELPDAGDRENRNPTREWIQFVWWGYSADLRHSGLKVGDREVPEITDDEDAPGLFLPTNCQPWAFGSRDVYERLHAAMKEEDR